MLPSGQVNEAVCVRLGNNSGPTGVHAAGSTKQIGSSLVGGGGAAMQCIANAAAQKSASSWEMYEMQWNAPPHALADHQPGNRGS